MSAWPPKRHPDVFEGHPWWRYWQATVPWFFGKPVLCALCLLRGHYFGRRSAICGDDIRDEDDRRFCWRCLFWITPS